MRKRKNFTIGISILFLVILLNTPTLNAQIYERGWTVGTNLLYSLEYLEKASIVLTNGSLKENYEYSESALIKVQISSIDELNERVSTEETWADGGPYSGSEAFNASYVSDDIADSLFYFYYFWDSNLNRIMLSSFNMYVYDFYPFVHPNWESFNKNLKAALDGDQIIYTVDTGSTYQNIYLSDFLNEVPFIINGQSTINESRNSFTGIKSRWKFNFDLSDYMLDRDYNYPEDIYEYYEYDIYSVGFELEYTKGGVLTEMTSSETYTITKDNVRYSYEEINTIAAGDSATTSTDFGLVSVIIVLILLPVLLPFKRKKN